ncbi:hypothetical protein SUGI_0982010 [Cryptomeria japonica]|nr:hypothetical protein SUGI_0982010 [Cryptomeria japonica]
MELEINLERGRDRKYSCMGLGFGSSGGRGFESGALTRRAYNTVHQVCLAPFKQTTAFSPSPLKPLSRKKTEVPGANSGNSFFKALVGTR